MRGTSVVAMATALLAPVLAVGCGQPPAPGSHAAAAPAAESACVRPRLAEPGRTFTVTGRDNGATFCVAPGTGVFVFLHGTPANLWTHIHPSSAAVQARPSGIMMLVRGVTGGYFGATRPGVAVLTSTRLPCRSASAAPGTNPCDRQTSFKVTLLISRRR